MTGPPCCGLAVASGICVADGVTPHGHRVMQTTGGIVGLLYPQIDSEKKP